MKADRAAMKPLCVDLFCGLGGWADGFIAEGYRVVGFDIERHDYGTGGYPGQLVIQDVLTLHGSQFRDVAVIVASPPCQEFSYMAMPWSRAKAKAEAYRARPENQKQLTALFDACFRIRREASQARTLEAGCKRCGIYHPGTTLDGCEFEPWLIPLVVENVCGAQKFVGRAKWHYGSFYLWGDVPALMPRTSRDAFKVPSENGCRTDPGNGARFTTRDCGVETGRKVPGIKLSQVGFNVAAAQRYRQEAASKNGGDWFGSGNDCSLQRKASSRSDSRKAASAHIAKIPFRLAQYIAQVYMPQRKEQTLP
jgi:hypothetical protein